MSTNKFPVPGQLSEKQQIFIDGLVKGGLSATAAARQAGYKQPKESAYYLTRSPRVVAAIRLARQTLYQTDLANLAAGTLKEVMQDQDAPPAARANHCKLRIRIVVSGLFLVKMNGTDKERSRDPTHPPASPAKLPHYDYGCSYKIFLKVKLWC